MNDTVLPTPDQVATLLRERRTIHSFKPEPVPNRTLERAIELASWAPNHRFTEPWRVYVLGPETAASIVQLSTELVSVKRGPEAAADKRKKWDVVPQWLVFTQVLSDDPLQQHEDYAACCCAIQNLQLYLWSAGIGCKWTTGPVTRDARMLELLWANPDDEAVVGLLQCGYPDEVPSVPRKGIEDYRMTLP